MYKKITRTVTLGSMMCLSCIIIASDLKEAPKVAPSPKPGLSISASGAIPIKHILDIPQIPHVTIDVAALRQAAEALKELKVNVDAKLPDVKVDISSEVLERAAKALSEITIKGAPTLNHQLQLHAPAQPVQVTHNISMPSESIELLATKCPAAIGFTTSVLYGGHPALTCCLGCITFTPYTTLKDATLSSYAALKAQMNRCFTPKEGRHAN